MHQHPSAQASFTTTDLGVTKDDTTKHAREVRALMSGADHVENDSGSREQTPAAFRRTKRCAVRSWQENRPLEPSHTATAKVPYPRMWNTRRGRYCKFKAPGAGVYGILRARPSFH
ncbi:MAG: hypothetical protein AAFP04_03655 [Myxococcota bacterium]